MIDMSENLELVKKVMEKTIFYDLDYFATQEDGTTKHLHSYRFLDEHPERRDSPEYTEEEEKELMKFMWAAANLF